MTFSCNIGPINPILFSRRGFKYFYIKSPIPLEILWDTFKIVLSPSIPTLIHATESSRITASIESNIEIILSNESIS